MHKKAQGLSLTTIVIAAAVLIVLIVLIGIFTGYFGDFVPSLKAAGEQQCSLAAGYTHEDESDGCGDAATRVYANFADGALAEGKICCREIEKECGAPPINGECTTSETCTLPEPTGLDGIVEPGRFSDCTGTEICCK